MPELGVFATKAQSQLTLFFCCWIVQCIRMVAIWHFIVENKSNLAFRSFLVLFFQFVSNTYFQHDQFSIILTVTNGFIVNAIVKNLAFLASEIHFVWYLRLKKNSTRLFYTSLSADFSMRFLCFCSFLVRNCCTFVELGHLTDCNTFFVCFCWLHVNFKLLGLLNIYVDNLCEHVKKC